MILFLDYDGVLHPDPCRDASRLFENGERLAQTLDPFPEVGIVLSTDWRHDRSHEELVGPLPERLRPRVLGQTPRYSQCPAPGARAPYRRHVECEFWLRSQGLAEAAWWALDDRPEWFSPYCENLLECDAQVGFDERVAARLASAVVLARRRAARSLDLDLC